jgi:hypothetical protein
LELGAQNEYITQIDVPPFADKMYAENGIHYSCIDLSGDNNAMRLDLAHPILDESLMGAFDLVTDFGTSEHVVQAADFEKVAFHDGHINSVYPKGVIDVERGYYECWQNKHNFLKAGGVMINVNPKKGNWPGHGYTYLDKDFYIKLAHAVGYEIFFLEENAAMGNTTDGWNIMSILRKNSESPFIPFEEFQTIPKYNS